MFEIRDFVSASRQRVTVLVSLDHGPKQVADLASELDSSLQSTSNMLRKLKEKGLIRCTTPERHSNRVYEITEEGEQTLEKIPPKTGYLRGRRFEMRVDGVLNSTGVPYTRNEKVEGERFEGRPDFVIEGAERSKLAVEVKRVPNKSAIPAVKAAAFNSNDLKRGEGGLKSALVAGGVSQKEELGQKILKLQHPDFFDRIFFGDELEEFARYVEDELGRE